MREFEESEPGTVDAAPAPKHDLIAKDDPDMPTSQFIASPAFQFYASDFLGSTKVARMSTAEIGIFTLLLCHAWNANGLPTSISELARMARTPVRRFQRLWGGVLSECWVERRGRLVNPRQEEIRHALIAYRSKQRANGEKGGRPRNPNQTQTKPTGKPKHKPKPKPEETSPISDLQSTDVSKEQKHPVREFLTDYDARFFSLTGEHPNIVKGRDPKIAKDTMDKYGAEKASTLLAAFFASTDPFIQRSGYGLNIFAGQINRLLVGDRPQAVTAGGRTGAPARGKYDGIEITDGTLGHSEN